MTTKEQQEIDNLRAENARLREALRHYTGVVESVNDPNNFSPMVRDAGHHARDLLRDLGEL